MSQTNPRSLALDELLTTAHRWRAQFSKPGPFPRQAALIEAIDKYEASTCRCEEEVDFNRPRVVVLCGSTRFKPEFEDANRRLTLDGCIVLAPGVFGHADGTHVTDEQKTALDALHFRKIDLADEVLIINPGDYIGESTRHEIEYAKRTGKPVRYLYNAEPAGTVEG